MKVTVSEIMEMKQNKYNIILTTTVMLLKQRKGLQYACFKLIKCLKSKYQSQPEIIPLIKAQFRHLTSHELNQIPWIKFM